MNKWDEQKVNIIYEDGERIVGNLAIDAMLFAMEIHKDQKRKYTHNPYSDHLAEVAGLVVPFHPFALATATAWLHDCMEDCGITYDFLYKEFSPALAKAVQALSDLEEGNRKERKQLSRERLSKADKWIQDVKVCDLISNTSSIVQHDPKFAKTYLEEKRLLLDVLTKADKRLLKIARGLSNQVLL